MNDKQILLATKRARRELHAATGYNKVGGHYKSVDQYLNSVEAEMARRLKPAPPKWANIGPLLRGGESVLDYSLTHDTGGIPLYPARDLAWMAGIDLVAPEGCVVFLKDTSASPGEALYLRGDSGFKYWLGHITRDWQLGHRFDKGEKIADVLDQSGTDHAHLGVNGEFYLGAGKEFKWGRNGNGPRYTTGAPTIRRQLQALSL